MVLNTIVIISSDLKSWEPLLFKTIKIIKIDRLVVENDQSDKNAKVKKTVRSSHPAPNEIAVRALYLTQKYRLSSEVEVWEVEK